MEIDKPTPKAEELLVKVVATTVNRTDWGILMGKPFIIRFFTGLRKPQRSIPGTDFAGTVEATGAGVTGFKKGDRVWGFDDNGLSSQAEYLTIPVGKPVSIIPAACTFEQAAASAEGAHYAYNFINKVKIRPAQKVLVNGATGAIGSAAVQFLKHYKAYVTAVCGTKNLKLVKSLGADRVIDYCREDFTQDEEKYDFVFDAVGKSTFFKCKRMLTKKGIYISSELGPYWENPFLALLTPALGGRQVKFPLPTNIKGSMAFIQSLIVQGQFRPVIDQIYPMEAIKAAYAYVGSGQKVGNVIVKVSD